MFTESVEPAVQKIREKQLRLLKSHSNARFTADQFHPQSSRDRGTSCASAASTWREVSGPRSVTSRSTASTTQSIAAVPTKVKNAINLYAAWKVRARDVDEPVPKAVNALMDSVAGGSYRTWTPDEYL